jgi:hypothetical protein
MRDGARRVLDKSRRGIIPHVGNTATAVAARRRLLQQFANRYRSKARIRAALAAGFKEVLQPGAFGMRRHCRLDLQCECERIAPLVRRHARRSPGPH